MNEQKPPTSFKKRTTAEKYVFRFPNGCMWAFFVIDEVDGSLMIMSDYGNWSYFWGSHGRPSFKHFLCELDRPNDSYLIGKLAGGQKELDWERSLKGMREMILEYRKEGGRKEKAKRMWDELKELGDHYARSEADFVLLMEEWAPTIVGYYQENGDSPAYMSPPYHLTRFVREVYPHFTAELRKEIESAGQGDRPKDVSGSVPAPV